MGHYDVSRDGGIDLSLLRVADSYDRSVEFAGEGGLRDNRNMTSAHPRITIEADKRDGRPCIRGMRITVNDILGWLAHGMTAEEILEEHPGLEKEDFAAVYAFAADMAETAYGGR